MMTFKTLYNFTAVCLFLVLMNSCSSRNLENQETKPPNIIFIMADDMGYGVPGTYGGKIIQTPFIDQLAAEGMKFTQAYAGSSVCAPSRSSLLLGQHVGHTSLRGNTGGIAINDEDTTFAEILKAKGYTTGGFGKWGLGDVRTSGVPEKQGFDEFFGYYHQIHAHFYYTDYLWNNGKKVEIPSDSSSESYTQNIIMKKMKQFIRDNKEGQFFCFGSWTIPHTDDVGNPVIPNDDASFLLYDSLNLPLEAKEYAGMNSRVDRDLGQIQSLLKELNIEDNTIVIFCSDNGGGKKYDAYFSVNQPFRGYKHTFYEGGIRVPFIVKWPGKINPGIVSELPIYFPDIMPTLADMANASDLVPNSTDGLSIVPTLLGNEDEQLRHEALYWELPAFDWDAMVYQSNELQQAIRMGDWKMLRHNTESSWELYDLKNDPSEMVDMAESNPQIIQKMEKWISENRSDMQDQIEPEMPEGKWFR
ncbi:MAG: arylsulfatase [Reichenbachiella sp.]|uniref:arylsulfatase n=1 Tax=Reichenbachiella sp. TaxID=2184521 RepID=UPI0029660AC8|nr:arylsulfatase [Reichenbachiella sp.]MDW3211450.1 arylsulfatase [Reichenbachiella sp.]